jgi:hypothetical protein
MGCAKSFVICFVRAECGATPSGAPSEAERWLPSTIHDFRASPASTPNRDTLCLEGARAGVIGSALAAHRRWWPPSIAPLGLGRRSRAGHGLLAAELGIARLPFW